MRNHRAQFKEAQEAAGKKTKPDWDAPTPYELADRPQTSTDSLYNPLPRLFAGIQFRNQTHKADLGGRIIREITEQREQSRHAARMMCDEISKKADVEIERLKNALELEQARHRADIFNFACGRNPMYDVCGVKERE